MFKKFSIGISLTSLIFVSSLHAATNLDQQMSLQEKQETGVVNMTQKQKKALAAWIDKNYLPMGQSSSSSTSSSQSSSAASQKSMDQMSNVTMSVNVQGGQELILSDSTRWQIQPQDVQVAGLWLTAAPISVKPSTDPDYPFILTNQQTNQSVRARQVASAPTPSIMQ